MPESKTIPWSNDELLILIPEASDAPMLKFGYLARATRTGAKVLTEVWLPGGKGITPEELHSRATARGYFVKAPKRVRTPAGDPFSGNWSN